MNYINRAFKNITRKSSKTILLGLTFFLIGNFIIVGLGISSAAESAKVMARKNMRAIVEYEVDHERIFEDAEAIVDEDEKIEFYENMPTINVEQLEKIMNDDRIKAINAIENHLVTAESFEYVRLGNEREQYDEDAGSGFTMTSSNMVGGIMPDGENIEYIEPTIKLRTNLFPIMLEFEDEVYELIDGKMYTQENIDNEDKVCLITDTLAETNGLSVGDFITINTLQPQNLGFMPSPDVTIDSGKVEMEIIGIFNNKEELDTSSDEFQYMAAFESPENIVLTPSKHITAHNYEIFSKQFLSNPEQFGSTELPSIEDMTSIQAAVILLNDPLDVNDFVDDMTKEDIGYFLFDANNETFDKLSKPLDTISLFSNIIIWLVIINAIVIITLVTALTLKTREYEIGVLLSLGVSKAKVVAQFFVELAIIAVIGFTFAVVSGSLIASSVGGAVLDYQVESSEVVEDDNMNGGWYGEENYFTDISLEDITAQYKVQINPLIIAQIYLAGLLMVLISILIPSLMIMRFNPKKILMNTN